MAEKGSIRPGISINLLGNRNCSSRAVDPIKDKVIYSQMSQDNKENLLGKRRTDEDCKFHVPGYSGKNSFCKKCEAFLPKVGSRALRELSPIIKSKINPNREYLFMMQKQEKNRLYNPQSSSLIFREELVSSLQKWSLNCSLGATTLYTATTYLDVVIATWDIAESSADKIALICLLIATKFHETCDQAPKVRYIHKMCKEAIGEVDVMRFENAVANTLNWDFDVQTPFHFVSFYLSKGVVFSSDTIPNGSISSLLENVRRFSSRASLIALNNYDLNKYSSHIIGATSVALSRLEYGILPIWPQELSELSWVRWEDLEKCFDILAMNLGILHKFKSVHVPSNKADLRYFRLRKGAQTCLNLTPEKPKVQKQSSERSTDESLQSRGLKHTTQLFDYPSIKISSGQKLMTSNFTCKSKESVYLLGLTDR